MTVEAVERAAGRGAHIEQQGLTELKHIHFLHLQHEEGRVHNGWGWDRETETGSREPNAESEATYRAYPKLPPTQQ